MYSFGPFYKIFGSNVVEGPDISIMSYNAMSFNRWGNIPLENVDGKIREFIKQENPDILCLQEHSRVQHRELKLYAFRAETPYSTGRTVQAIFSKFPITNKGSLEPEGTRNNIIYADIVLPNDTIRVYNVHFQSFKIVPSKENLKKNEPFRLAKKISAAIDQQLNQVKVLREHMKSSVHPTLICGDFNSTQFSQIYRMASDGFQDSFFEKGNDWGSTYKLKGLPLRIDYILADHSFEVVSHQNYDIQLSDHYPVSAEFKLKLEK
ncbi:hypothetical protein FGF1_04310 [Flavobacteriaceae bacterium GF1]